MRTIIAGSRGIHNPCELQKALALCGWTPTVVICGMASGADKLGLEWAAINGVPVERYPADWGSHGKSAGYIRNKRMALDSEACIVLWDGVSRGTAHMISLATEYELRLYIHRV